MSRKLWVLASVAAAVAVVLALAAWWQARPGPEAPFTDLETAVAGERRHGWVLHVRPRREGPYRLLPGGGMIPADPAQALTSRIHDDAGNVVEELKVQGSADYDLTAV